VNTPPRFLKRLTEGDDVQSFDCGSNKWDVDVADFLKEDALNQQKMGLNATWLCWENGELVGYTSLVASTLVLKGLPDWMNWLGLGQIRRTDVPCILVAQFGVTSSARRQGIGSFMLSWVRGAAFESIFGVKLLTLHVDTRNDVGRSFWNSQSFINFPPAGGKNHLFMVFDLYG